nr:immunoglobulin heavy chain junction region [Macaca mulatta]MOW94398.1 immunoglobulin heavy chain junction region [Macaca mulatta]MOW94863.1 immunoglobulin heavy chain junction region [Macaca mulatta]MOW95645.1 immunoglobulin heavy chain junction region [Macaca mulatta]MOW96216.1 immunoglobulin heavy chain junction region [Macaca mulatta]
CARVVVSPTDGLERLFSW